MKNEPLTERGGGKTKRKVLLISFVAFLMLFAVAMPVFACPLKHGTFTQIIVSVGLPGGTSTIKGNILYATGSDANFIYAPTTILGSTITSANSGSFKLNTVSLTGCGYLTTTDTYAAGRVKGFGSDEFNGPGAYVYNGPTFNFNNVGGLSGTITNGATYGGVLISGVCVKHGVSGTLAGYETFETYSGIVIKAGPLAGATIMVNTVNYWFTK